MDVVQTMDNFIFSLGVMTWGEEDEDGEEQQQNLNLIKLEKLLLDLAASDACEGILYFLGLPTEDNKLYVRCVWRGGGCCLLIELFQ